MTAIAFEWRRSLAAGLTALLALAPAWAQSPDPTSGDLVLVPGPLLPLLTPEGTPTGAVGWNIPGRHFKSSEGWWALACKSECTLTATRLQVSPATHPDYDAPPMASQFLQWNPLPYGLAAAPATAADGTPVKGEALLLAVFKPIRSLAALDLRAGPLKTWLHAGMKRYPRPKSEGTMETLIPLEGGETAVLMPRLLQAKANPAASGNDSDRGDQVVLELRAKGLRQRLEAFQFEMDGFHPLAGQDYLLWAGDLDGDGKLDLLVRYAERGWNTVLYLSSKAGPGQLVGEAGRFNYFDPSDPGC